jgi:hypothetical protein
MDEELKLEFMRRTDQAGDEANMWRIGEGLGLDRGQVETLCMDLLSEGLLEMKNLGGSIVLAQAGREQLAGAPAPGPNLGTLLDELEGAGDLGLAGPAAGDLAADLACLRAQLSRSRPLAAVVQACLQAVAEALAASRQERARDLASQVRELL